MSSHNPLPTTLLLAETKKMRRAPLRSTVRDADELLALLKETREQVATSAQDGGALALTKLQNPLKNSFDSMTSSLKDVSKAQKNMGKAIDKAFPARPLPVDFPPLLHRPELVNRAIAMHLLREGQFPAASTFVQEARSFIAPMNPDQLQSYFQKMYHILTEMKKSNLEPAMEWARINHTNLEQRQSTLEFDLVRLQYMWLCKGPSVNGLPDDDNNGLIGALKYSNRIFPRFKNRNAASIEQLGAALAFSSNIEESPYHHLFDMKTAFDDVSIAFTRMFCSLLGLSAESPLYMAATAGSMSLPQVLKFSKIQSQKTEWSTTSELAFETPLPRSMIFHPIFVCPVLKEQTTAKNPPILLPCGHVICKEAFIRLKARISRLKCPYCPMEVSAEATHEIRF
ncbi:hypothetical protein Cpir12675_003843 [Ceratocystis pirilliformis]|uniref:Uncharacterized protein n=1 Tax=Ceratocystis pirilliformis TaxID=259994 RepID=A0ABR3Z1G6_9PEZI